MSYEYMSGMGLGKNGGTPSASAGGQKTAGPIAEVPVPTGVQMSETAFVSSETQGVLARLTPLITRARAGDAAALQTLRSPDYFGGSNEEVQEYLTACAQNTPGLAQGFCEAIRTAQQLASGQTTSGSSSSDDENGESNTGLYIGLGVGAGVLALMGIVLLSKKKKKRSRR